MKRKLMSLVLCAAMVGSMVGVTTTVHAEDEISIEIVSGRQLKPVQTKKQKN